LNIAHLLSSPVAGPADCDSWEGTGWIVTMAPKFYGHFNENCFFVGGLATYLGSLVDHQKKIQKIDWAIPIEKVWHALNIR